MKKISLFFLIALLCLGLNAEVLTKTASYGLLLSDDGNTIVMNSTSNLIVSLPSLTSGNLGYTVTIVKANSGQVKIQAPLADYVENSAVNGYIQNTVVTETSATITLQLSKANYWQITAKSGTWISSADAAKYGTAAATGNVATEGASSVHTTVLTLTAVPIEPAAAAAGIAFDYVKLYDFPAGYIYVQGIVADLTLTDATATGSEMAGNYATWTATSGWDYDSTTAGEWHHATGDATALVTDVAAVAGTTYEVEIVMATSTAGDGLVVSMGGVTQSEVHGSTTVTFQFTASATTALTFTPTGAGDWVGDITSVTVTSISPISTTWDGDIAFGTTADADGSLASTEVDLVPSTATTQAVAGVAAADCQSTATEHAIFDGHTVAKDLILNLLIDAADFVDAGTGSVTITGTVTVTWINLGDN